MHSIKVSNSQDSIWKHYKSLLIKDNYKTTMESCELKSNKRDRWGRRNLHSCWSWNGLEAVFLYLYGCKNVREGERDRESPSTCVQLSTWGLWCNPPGQHSCTDTWRGSSRAAAGKCCQLGYQTWNWIFYVCNVLITVFASTLHHIMVHNKCKQLINYFISNYVID